MTIPQTLFSVFFLMAPAAPACPALSLEAAWSASRELLSRRQAPNRSQTGARPGPGTCLFNGKTGQPASAQDVLTALERSRAVSVGETHDQPNDHLAQLEALKSLAAVRDNKVAVGFEMLNESLQPVLDAYASGTISESDFLEQSGWKQEWGFSFALYRPLFDFIRGHRLKALALNAPRGIVTKTARLGIAGLSAEEKALLPKDMELSQDPRYLAFLKAAFSGHKAGMPGVTWAHYLEAMMIWNEVMAANVAAYLNANADSAVLIAAGNGHVMYGAGIPFGVGRRAPGAGQTTFYTEGSAVCPKLLSADLSGLADFIWLVPHSGGE
ncbi:MAG TPA: hypothetical protein DEB40_06640 [Elusimicrobia bacterium]|nr:hypothetical protein [Elusimicrobiota bacterium]HBT61405.1 hypothetical protein [Elusimicrobiota bacterium]